NYRATFTILDVPSITRGWIDDIKARRILTDNCPAAWREFIEHGAYHPLRAERSLRHRRPAEQLPTATDEVTMLQTLVGFFKAHPQGEYAFEACAAELFRMMDPNVTRIDLTRFRVDGGRDAVGKYRLGRPGASIEVEFALEAKCKKPAPTNSSGVKETSRLISRLRHRQFGVFVTTSCVGEQAYKEIVDDQHPVVVLAGKDLVAILKEKGISTPARLEEWLAANFSEGARV
ncbi:MAG: restriction endonuclease, partial [Roseibacillus sp.]